MGGDISETFFTQKVENLEKEGRKILKSDTADLKHPLDLTFELEEQAQSGELDGVFFFTDETYQKHKRLKNKMKKSKKYIPKNQFYKLD